MKKPDPERLIRLHGFDWSGFTVVGKWVLYKGQKNGRFMKQDEYGNWIAAIDDWKNGTRWEYVSRERYL